VDPVSRRDFWELLHRLVQEGMTVFVTTAYMDEAERCDRVGLLHQGRLVRCDTPNAIKLQLEEECYQVQARDLRSARGFLETVPGVSSVEPAGATLHLFLSSHEASPASLERGLAERGLGPATVEKIAPSLEDVFIYLIRKASRVGG
jgi:ABC-2 type transport system ATP-binding protein